jgi:hypothetical protein
MPGVLCIMRHSMLAILLLAVPGNAQEMAHNHGTHNLPKKAESPANRFGSVQFETSCTSAVKEDFNTAVALLHSFEYDEAQVAFAEISRKDPTCAMAMWGESMSYFHGIWNEFNASKGARAAAEGIQVAAENPLTTEREKTYIAAISEIFSEDAIRRGQSFDSKPDLLGYSRPSPEAEAKYTQRMADLHTQFPAAKRPLSSTLWL